jgi:hypothetical protein
MAAPARFKDFCLDANDVTLLADFWSTALGLELTRFKDGDVKLSGDGMLIWVNAVPEPKTAKNRVHIDVTLAGDTPQPLVDLGARVLTAPLDADHPWWVMADPEGNEFCAFPTSDASPA